MAEHAGAALFACPFLDLGGHHGADAAQARFPVLLLARGGYDRAVHAAGCFVVVLRGAIHCFLQNTGEVVGKFQIVDGSWRCISLAARDNDVLAWAKKGEEDAAGHVVFSLSVPKLERRDLLEPDWYSAVTYAHGDIIIGTTIGRVDTYHIPSGKKIWEGGQWWWDGVHDGFIYFSATEPDGKHTSVNRIEVKTGNACKIYEEELPASMQLKPMETAPAPAGPKRESDYRL
jgi:hypothetical protein